MNIWDIFEYTIMASAVGLLIWVVKLIFHDKLDARWHYFIWLVLLVRLAAPVHFALIRTPLSLFGEMPVGRWLEIARLTAEKRGYGNLTELFGRIYLWGAAGLGGCYVLVWLALRVRLARAPRADADTVEYVGGIAAKYGLKSCRDIRVCRSATPYICGALRPVLVLPRDNTRPEEAVVVHELLHGKYRDVLVNLAIHVVRAVNWFNPALWMLSAVAQNDSEALCDQRVLEYCGEDRRQEYGEMLLGMSEGRKPNPVKIGTSNMASSYRNMRTRIRRIGDFRRVPARIGFVTLCITLMLAVACIGSSAEVYSFEIPQVNSQKDLERALVYAQCYHAHTPEEAVYLFLRACDEGNLLYRMAVMPGEEVSGYEEFARMWFEKGGGVSGADFHAGTPESDSYSCSYPYPSYFPRESSPVLKYDIYNLQYDNDAGSATVCARLSGSGLEDGRNLVEWRLELVREDGWKVRLTGETERFAEQGVYQPEPLLYGSGRMGDFLVELACHNEGYFQQLGGMGGLTSLSPANGEGQEDVFPTSFTEGYKCQSVYVTYLGEESLEQHIMKVVVSRNGEKTGAESVSYSYSCSYGDSEGNSYVVFGGQDLMSREAKLVSGSGSGSGEPGWGWKLEESAHVYVEIYIDGALAEEGEVWSEGH